MRLPAGGRQPRDCAAIGITAAAVRVVGIAFPLNDALERRQPAADEHDEPLLIDRIVNREPTHMHRRMEFCEPCDAGRCDACVDFSCACPCEGRRVARGRTSAGVGWLLALGAALGVVLTWLAR